MGRDKKNERLSGHFTPMYRATMETKAWRALSATAQALYPWVKLEWKGPKANNNSKISLSVRQAAERLGVTPDTANRAFRDLQAKGFLVVTEYGTLGSTGEAKSHCYEITELPLPHGSERNGRRLFEKWDDIDLPVLKMRANNPRGLNGQTESQHETHDGAVTKIVSFRRGQS